jgi:hypothetical protein
MRTQSYKNHVHTPTAATVGTVFLVLAWIGFGLRWFRIGGAYTMALGVGSLSLAVAALIYISRVYITRLQDRIIRLEMRVRGASLLTPAQQRILADLDIKQVAALRFASDPELGPLVERAARDHLTPRDIKRAITTWVPDWHRT